MTGTDASVSAPPISVWRATRFWTKLGFLSFGGPAGQIALMHIESVQRRHWISERRFLHASNYCMVLPSLLILIALSWIYVANGHVPLVAGLL